MFEVELIGENELVTRFAGMSDAIRQLLAGQMRTEMGSLLAAVRGNLDTYASATMENHGPSGNLAASLQSAVSEDETLVQGRVFSDGSAPYALVQELGGGGGAVIVPKLATYLHYVWRGTEWFKKAVIRGDTPAKRYLRNALSAEGPAIVERLHAAVLEGVKKP